jgi:hypothetical protein
VRHRVWLIVPLVLLAARAAAFELESAAFRGGETIPVAYTCDGADRSPPLAWHDPPPAAKGFALVCEDPDAPAGLWTHWVLFDLPAGVRELAAGLPAAESLPGGGRQGVNDFRRTGYGGPCPPHGAPHRYVFRLYALDGRLDLAPGATRAALLQAMEGHVVGQAELTGRYARR